MMWRGNSAEKILCPNFDKIASGPQALILYCLSQIVLRSQNVPPVRGLFSPKLEPLLSTLSVFPPAPQ